mmetsp:Transcript_32584/g.75998  ORF Transcript_32584/g.75998 Transcript_32584/m.75998 type:complete len:141 (-) Transcript_32584:43-465(-)
MYLTRLHFASPTEAGAKEEHEEAECLLESYLQEIGSVLGAVEVLEYNIESTEKFVSFRLDSARNRLLKVDVLATTTAAIFALGSFAVGVFGMNLQHPLFVDEAYSNGNSFYLALAMVLLLMVLLFVMLFLFFSPRFHRQR